MHQGYTFDSTEHLKPNSSPCCMEKSCTIKSQESVTILFQQQISKTRKPYLQQLCTLLRRLISAIAAPYVLLHACTSFIWSTFALPRGHLASQASDSSKSYSSCSQVPVLQIQRNRYNFKYQTNVVSGIYTKINDNNNMLTKVNL